MKVLPAKVSADWGGGRHPHLRHEEVRGGSDHRSPVWTGCVTRTVASGNETPTIPSDPARREMADRPLPNHTPLPPSDLKLAPPISQPQRERGPKHQNHPLIGQDYVLTNTYSFTSIYSLLSSIVKSPLCLT